MRLILLLLLALAAGGCDRENASSQQGADSPAGPVKGVDRSKVGQALPDLELANADGEAAALAEEKGEPVLVNLWATWCAPCVKELPTLEALAARPGAPRVIAVSQDMAPRGSVDAFLERHELGELEVWQDSKMGLSGALGVEVLPTTILFDADGKEVWRYVGDLDWSGAEAARLLAEAKTPVAG